MKNKRFLHFLLATVIFNFLFALFFTTALASDVQGESTAEKAMYWLLTGIVAAVVIMIILTLAIGIFHKEQKPAPAIITPKKAETPQNEPKAAEKEEKIEPEKEEEVSENEADNEEIEDEEDDDDGGEDEDDEIDEEAVESVNVLPLDEDKGFTITAKYRRSFLAKLIQSHSPVQKYYNEIKNELLSYGKIKSRVSWNYDSFTFGRQTVAKILINGKTLIIFLALKPSSFPQSKYHHKDVSAKAKYAKTPFMMKMRSDRSVKYVKELISVYMQLNDIEKNNRKDEDYFMPYETTQALVRKNLIKELKDE